ncbi:hypothetical protein ABZ801_41455 [Actinomadura sp. NPDC047616]|uniref:hypothetical protein n=1 Tax=Actinomadura sp. NPDC047616 TaxID=3155914 RepID=UPI0033E85121
MDIIPLAAVITGAFAGGVTVGALCFSPRLVSMTARAEVTPPPTSERPPAVYVLPGQPGAPAAPVIPPGYVMAPGMILGQSGGPAAMIPMVSPDPAMNPGASPLRQTRNDRDIDSGQDIPLIMPASDRAPGHPREGRR